jgi:hypothetical protein
MQVQFAVQSYQARALPLSAQRVVNLYAEAAPKDAKDPVVVYGTPGIKEWANPVGDGPIRGAEVMDGVLYAVSACVLYSIDSTGRATALGSIQKGGAGEPGVSGEASATFQITNGTESAGTNQITSITVGGTEVLGGSVNWITSNAATADAVITMINDHCIFQPTYSSISLDVSGQTTVPTNIVFKPDGTKMYITGVFGGTPDDAVYQYTLGTPFALSTASYDNVELDVSAQGDSPTGLAFSSDGTKLFILDSDADAVFQYSLSTAWDLSTGSYDSVTLDVSTEETSPNGIAFKDDGTKMYIVGSDTVGDPVYQYSLSTAWDLSTASYDNVSFNTTDEGATPVDVTFTDNGTKMYILGNNNVKQYTLSTAWDLSTASYDGLQIAVNTEDSFPQGITFSGMYRDLGLLTVCKMFMVGRTNDTIYEYWLPVQRYFGFVTGPNGDWIVIRALPGTGSGPNGLAVVITTSGDVQVDQNNLTMAGAFQMPGGDGTGQTPDCFGKVSMSHNAATTLQLAIVDGTNGWIYTTTGGLVEITDDDFFPADVVDFQDQYFIFNRAGTGQWFLSNLNDGTLYTATDIATAEGDPDNTISIISNRRELWQFGAETIEVWYNSGASDFPFTRFEGGFIERGCAAAFSVAEDDNAIFWLAEDRIVYRVDGYVPQRISQHGVEEAFRDYAVIEDACAFIYTMAGHKFYVLTFPTEKTTWVYDITTGLWHERESFGLGRWRASVYVNAYGKHLVGDFQDGKIGELDLDTYQEYGVTMQGQATGPPVYKDRKRIFHRRFELDIETGTGLTSGQGSDPQVWLDYSDDGGHSWSERKPARSMGKIGAYLQRLRWLRMGQARQRIYRLTVADPVKRSFVAAHLDAQAADH